MCTARTAERGGVYRRAMSTLVYVNDLADVLKVGSP